MQDLQELFPIPELVNCKRLLCIQPHPDDMDIGAGGTIAHLSDAGSTVIYLTLTDDTAGFTMDFGKKPIPAADRIKIRREEQIRAGKCLGVKEYYWLDFPDAGNWQVYDARNEIIKFIRLLRPDFIMTVDPWLPYEAHLDHIKCGLAASEAVLLYNFAHIETEKAIDNAYAPYDIQGIAFCITREQNQIIDTGKYKERKFKAVSQHTSQFTPESFAAFKLYDQFKANKITETEEFSYGEGFKVLSPDMLHIAPECMRTI